MTRGRGTGLALALASAAALGTSGALAGSLIRTGWTPAAAVLVRVSLAALALTVPAVLALRGRWSVVVRGSRTVLAYGILAVAGAQLAYFNAVSHLSVGVALLLEYQGIVLVVLWMWLRHGRRPRPLMLAGAGLALVGLVLVLDVFGGLRLDGVGVLWGLAAAVGLAVYFVVAAGNPGPAGEGEQMPPLVLSCLGLWVGAAGLAVAGVARLVPLQANTAPVELAGRSVAWLVPVLGLALVAAAFAYVVGTVAARLLGATLASFVGLTEVVFAVLFAWVLLGQLPTLLQLAGGVVVLAGIALVRLDELRAPAAVSPAAMERELAPAQARG